MRKFITTLLLAAGAAALISCGGGKDPGPIAQCNGTPKAAVVYVGDLPFPELAAVPDACVYSTAAATIEQLDGVVDQAMTMASRPRVYLIGTYTDLPLRWRAARPGAGEITSLWFPPDTATGDGIVNSVATIYINGEPGGTRTCSRLQAQLLEQRTAADCLTWDHGGFTEDQRQAAILQLHLEGVRKDGK